MSGERVTWQGFLRRYPNDADARLLLLIGGEKPTQVLDRIEYALESGEITPAEYKRRVGVLSRWRYMFRETAPVVDHKDGRDWKRIGEGSYQRVEHKDAASGGYDPTSAGEDAG